MVDHVGLTRARGIIRRTEALAVLPVALCEPGEPNALARARVELRDAIVRERELALQDVPRGRRDRRVAHDRFVLAGDERETKRRALRLLHLGDDVAARLVLHEDLRLERARQLEL